ncbi:hypothetical protein [Bosea sp. PAMC 26642]|uniref:hypothetical protein n=1 Tax=Bosea sp. (strain PAMC 26642) TaxID=1792307 RepID=UPI0012E7CDC9|nr:hypothetical protein [Bosea sp. PAMC 26642]
MTEVSVAVQRDIRDSRSLDRSTEEGLSALTQDRLEAAMLYLAECIVAAGPAYAPFLQKLEDDLATMMAGRDPISRAYAIIAKAKAKQGA